MPWTPNDVDKHYGDLTDKQKRQWCHVANGALENGDDDGTAIKKASGAVNNSRMESVLYTKAAAYMNAARVRAAARFWEEVLNEADPKPRVEKDIKGEYVVPTENQFQTYFDAMTAANIDKMLNQTRERWKEGADKADDVKAKAEAQAAKLELEVGQAVLQHKKAMELGIIPAPEIKPEVTEPELRSVIQNVVSMLMKAV